jgi:hypothetical protein
MVVWFSGTGSDLVFGTFFVTLGDKTFYVNFLGIQTADRLSGRQKNPKFHGAHAEINFEPVHARTGQFTRER